MSPGRRLTKVLHHCGPATAQLATRLRHQLTRWLREADVPSDTAAGIELASYEAMANTVVHAYPRGTVGMVELRASRGADDVTVIVADHGRWKERDLTTTGGRGLPLIRKLANRAEISAGHQGTTVRMAWLLAPGT